MGGGKSPRRNGGHTAGKPYRRILCVFIFEKKGYIRTHMHLCFWKTYKMLFILFHPEQVVYDVRFSVFIQKESLSKSDQGKFVLYGALITL